MGYLLPQVDFPTGTVQVEVNSDGVPRYDIREQVAWDHIPYTDSLRELARNCCAVCFGSLAQRSEVSRTTINRFLDDTSEASLRIFDINLRQNFYTSETILSSLQKCNILKLNEEEVTLLAQMFGYDELNLRAVCRSVVKDYALQVLILTCGANGSYVFTPDESSYYDTPKVEVADTVGAGDSFTGAFCAALTARQVDPCGAPAGSRRFGLCLHAAGRHAPTARKPDAPPRSRGGNIMRRTMFHRISPLTQ